MGSLGDVERTTTEIQCLTVSGLIQIVYYNTGCNLFMVVQALNHPSIIKLLRVINEPNHVVLVIELLEGCVANCCVYARAGIHLRLFAL